MAVLYIKNELGQFAQVDTIKGDTGIPGQSMYEIYVETTIDDPIKSKSEWLSSYEVTLDTENASILDSNITASNQIGTWIPEFTTVDKDRIITEVRIKGTGTIWLVHSNETFEDIQEIQSLTMTNNGGINVFIGLAIKLPAGRRLGVRVKSAENVIYYKMGVSVGEYKTYDMASVGNFTVAIGFTTVSASYAMIGQMINNLQGQISDINELINKNPTAFLLWEDKMQTAKPDWIATGWTHDPTNKKWDLSSTGRANNLFLNRVNNFNKKRAVFRLIPSGDTDFRIEMRNGNGSQTGDGESLFGVNFATNKIAIYRANKSSFANENVETYGVLEDAIVKEGDLLSPYVSGREYIIEIRYYETLHTMKITDTVTGKQSIIEQDGWIAGRQQQSYSFYRYAGMGTCSIKDMRMYTIGNVELGIDGDSIMEGVMVQDKTQRWWKLAEPHIAGNILVGARGGFTVTDLINKFDSTWAIVKPKKLMFTIGVNGGATTGNYQALKQKCIDNGIIPIFNYLCLGGSSSTINTTLISAVGEEYMGLKFHLATSTNNDGITRNETLYYDSLHPKESGNNEMVKRIFIDLPDILK